MISINPNDNWEYVCECDRGLPEDEQTVFVLRVPTEAEAQSLLRLPITQFDQLTIEHVARILGTCLVNWKNLMDSNRQPVQFSREGKGASKQALGRIPIAARFELASRVIMKLTDTGAGQGAEDSELGK